MKIRNSFLVKTCGEQLIWMFFEWVKRKRKKNVQLAKSATQLSFKNLKLVSVSWINSAIFMSPLRASRSAPNPNWGRLKNAEASQAHRSLQQEKLEKTHLFQPVFLSHRPPLSNSRVVRKKWSYLSKTVWKNKKIKKVVANLF